jgi:hypothetical protein
MASAFVLTGSVMGFLTANVMFWAYDTALLMAVAVWILSGPASAALYVVANRGPRQPQAREHSPLSQVA